MTIQVTAEGLRKIFPRAPRAVIEDLAARWQVELDSAGISHTRRRLSDFFSNIEHECGGFTIKNLTENINYTPERAAQIWPRRFPGGAAQVREKYGTAPGWQKKMFDDVYGNRMGNRKGTSDGSTYIGRGGPQWTGRDGYEAVERITDIPAVINPDMVAAYVKQPEVCCAFWTWKKLQRFSDVGDFKGLVRAWNGGQIGMADRLAQLAGNDPIIARLEEAKRIEPTARELPGAPPTPKPPQEVIDEVTRKERAAQKAGTATAGTGGAGELGKAATEQPSEPPALLSPLVTWSLIGVGVAVLVVATILVIRKKAKVIQNWF